MSFVSSLISINPSPILSLSLSLASVGNYIKVPPIGKKGRFRNPRSIRGIQPGFCLRSGGLLAGYFVVIDSEESIQFSFYFAMAYDSSWTLLDFNWPEWRRLGQTAWKSLAHQLVQRRYSDFS